MGDTVFYIASPAPAPLDVIGQLERVRTALVADGILMPGDAPEAILGTPRGPVRRPGSKTIAAEIRDLQTLLTNGAEFCEQPIFNWGQLNTDELMCGSCGVVFRSGDKATPQQKEAFRDQLSLIGTAAGEANFADDAVTCLGCETPSAVNDWAEGDGFILAGFGIGLWNWNVFAEVLDPVRNAMAKQMPQVVFAEDGYKI